MDVLTELLEALDDLALAQAQQARHAPVHPLSVGGQVPPPDPHTGGVEGDPEKIVKQEVRS